MFPAHSRHRAETCPFVARFGHQVQRTAPELHARQVGRTVFRDDAVHPVHRYAPEFEWRPHGHVPLAAQRAFELVLESKTAAVKIQPPRAGQGQPVRCRVGIAPAKRFERQAAGFLDQEGRKIPPLRRHIGLGRFH